MSKNKILPGVKWFEKAIQEGLSGKIKNVEDKEDDVLLEVSISKRSC